MTQGRKRYGRQFKASAAKAVLSGGMTVKDLSEELGIKDVSATLKVNASLSNI